MKSQNKIIIALICLSIVLVVVGTAIGVTQYYKNRLLPGTQIGGVDVSGMTRMQAEEILIRSWPKEGAISLEWNSLNFPITYQQLNLEYDALATINQIGVVSERQEILKIIPTLINNQNTRINHEPIFEINNEELNKQVANVAGEINIPAQNPEILYDKGTATITVTSGENGQEVDQELLKQRILAAIRSFSNQPLSIPVRQLQPKLSEQQIALVKTRAMKMVNKGLTLRLSKENQEWKIETEQLIRWLEPAEAGWKEMDIGQWVTELAQTIDRPAQNASFRFVPGGKVEEFKPEKDGYQINQAELVRLIQVALGELEMGIDTNKQIEVVVGTTKPEVLAGQINDLGIKTLIGKGESWFSGSITNRIFNLKRAADLLNGVLIPPGEEFSFNKAVGEISLATGFRQAFVIKDGKTLLGDGGGVCQTSSTLFRAVLNAGLPIDERVAHAYRVSYYEENYQPGFDATIFQPAPDFKFKNDTPGHVLIQTSFDEKKKYLAFELYGTSDGRKTEVSKARVWDVVAPPPDLYIDDPTLPVGQVKQTEHAARGSKVAFDWKVTRGDEVLQERTFYSNYKPWQAVYLRGTKVN